jgi:hypothetical protein
MGFDPSRRNMLFEHCTLKLLDPLTSFTVDLTFSVVENVKTDERLGGMGARGYA